MGLSDGLHTAAHAHINFSLCRIVIRSIRPAAKWKHFIGYTLDFVVKTFNTLEAICGTRQNKRLYNFAHFILYYNF